ADGDLERARASYRKAIAWDSLHAKAHNTLGWLLHAQGALDAAIACYGRALQADRLLVEAPANLAIACHAKGDLVRAEEYSRQALALQPRVDLYRLRADILRKSGRLDEALECRREAPR